MKIEIDAIVTAHTLAIADVHKEYNLLTLQQVKEIVDGNEFYINSSAIASDYRDKYDYYFEILTNHAL